MKKKQQTNQHNKFIKNNLHSFQRGNRARELHNLILASKQITMKYKHQYVICGKKKIMMKNKYDKALQRKHIRSHPLLRNKILVTQMWVPLPLKTDFGPLKIRLLLARTINI